MKIDTSRNKIPIWLVWSLTVRNKIILNAMCLEQGRAAGYRKALMGESHAHLARVWIEKTEANHLYALETGGVVL